MATETTVEELLSELTVEEKCTLVSGASDPTGRATGYLEGVERLDVPSLGMADGPLGVRIPHERATAFPAPLSLAATFDTELAYEHGAALGRETREKGMDSVLAPGTNLIRTPQNGRNFEYFSEDPLHSAAFAAAVTAGIESQDVVATPKHYVANNQETDRVSVSAEVSERALRELYLPSFEAAVDAGAGSVMTAYNAVNGTSMSEHGHLVRDVLKDEFGFEGYVVSDWFATEGAAAAANGGLDVEMPGIPMTEMANMMSDDASPEDDPVETSVPSAETADSKSETPEIPFETTGAIPDPSTCERFSEALVPAIESGEVPEERLDDMVRRVLTVMADRGILDDSRVDPGSVDVSDHHNHAERVAARGTVLLENDGLLPLADDADVAVIGPNIDEALLGGGGSSEVEAANPQSPATGIEERSEGDVSLAYGLPPVESVSMMDIFQPETDDDEPTRKPDIENAAQVAKDADVSVVFVRDVTTEAMDRESLELPGRQHELVEAVAEANDRTIVVVNSSGPVAMPWREAVAAVVEGWYPGQAHGTATAAVLYGDTDPSGRLPVTFAPEEAYPTSAKRRFPGEDGSVRYEEGVFVGYRAFDSDTSEPTYPFGHGHSYADFTYGDATLDDGRLSVPVENVSDRDGHEVVQAYVRPPETTVDRPERELAGFAAIEVPAGDTTTAEIDLDDRAFDRYDESEGWTTDPGTYTIEVGRSVRDVRTEVEVER